MLFEFMFLLLPIVCLLFCTLGAITGYFFYRKRKINVASGILLGAFTGAILGVILLGVIFIIFP